MEETVSKGFVEEFLRHNGGDHFGEVDGKDVWIMPDGTVIQLPLGNGRIDIEHFEGIASEQVGIPYWEIDYILGQNGYKGESKKATIPKSKDQASEEL